MDKTVAFPILLDGYVVEGLEAADAPRLRPLYEACADYMDLERGEAPGPHASREEFESFPPDRTAADKFIFGLRHADGRLVGILACDRDYPAAGRWWIALFMISPELRGKTIGRAFFAGFLAWLRTQGAGRVELAVLAANERGRRFWQARDFQPVRTTDPRPFGRKRHVLHIMGLSLRG